MSKIRCVVIDDEPRGLQLLKIYCEQLEQYCEIVDSFLSTDIFLAKQKEINYDLLLLDIDMAGVKGTDLARILSDKPVVFVTGKSEFDKEVLELQLKQSNILALIRKPPDKENLEIAFNKYLTYRKRRSAAVFQTSIGDRNIPFDEIMIITTKATGFKKGILNKYKIEEKFHARNKILVTKKEILKLNSIDFEELENILSPEEFFLIHRSIIVARRAIRAYDHEGIAFIPELTPMIAEAQFNVSEDYLKEFKQWFRN